MQLYEVKASQNLLNVMDIINLKPVKCCPFAAEAGGQAAGKTVRYHLIDFSTLPLLADSHVV
ncbi:MAG: hypothetical protein HY754_07685 [Nitrospirae bacterium]|nr:hypothetical protein [Nitrospirota bacterium]